MDVTIIPAGDGHAADIARTLLGAAGPDRTHLVRTRSDVPGGLAFVAPADIAASASLAEFVADADLPEVVAGADVPGGDRPPEHPARESGDGRRPPARRGTARRTSGDGG